MANYQIVFYDFEDNETELTALINYRDHIVVSVDNKVYAPSIIELDKSTAIKFAKTLRTLINQMEDERMD